MHSVYFYYPFYHLLAPMEVSSWLVTVQITSISSLYEAQNSPVVTKTVDQTTVTQTAATGTGMYLHSSDCACAVTGQTLALMQGLKASTLPLKVP